MEVPLGDTYYFKFTTRQFSTGAPFALAGTPALSVYEENNLTQITAGITLTASYDSVTGLNDVAIVCTSGNGYEVGKYYDVVITTGTVDSVSVVGEVVGHFRIMPAEDAGAGIKDVNVATWLDTAVTLSGGNPDVNVESIDDAILTAAKFAANCLTSDKIDSTFVNEHWNKVIETQGSYTAQQAMSIYLAALAGVTSNGGATLETPNGVSNRIVATVNGSNERTAVTLTPSS